MAKLSCTQEVRTGLRRDAILGWHLDRGLTDWNWRGCGNHFSSWVRRLSKIICSALLELDYGHFLWQPRFLNSSDHIIYVPRPVRLRFYSLTAEAV